MSRIVKGLFGGTSSEERILQRFRPTGLTSGGFNVRFDQASNTNIGTRTAARESAIAGVTGALGERAQAFRGLRGEVRPGFGRLSQIRREGMRSRLAAFGDTARRTVGNIREELARRRLGGSSFQQNQVAAAEAEFGRQADVIRAETEQAEAEAFLQEVGLSTDLVAQEFDASVQAANTVLEQLNLDTALTAGFAQLSSQLLAANIQAQAEARSAQNAAGEDFLGTVLGLFAPGAV